jgi:DNA polymerase-3 subunit delta'
MKNLVINNSSEKTLLALVKNMPQSLLLSGEPGIGLGAISRYIAELRNVSPIIILPEKDEKIDLAKGVVSVDIMRRLYEETRTKTAKERIIIIDYAERMTHQAQNAFLKLLEEPGAGIYFILVSHSISKLLPTILSRTEKLEIRPITLSQSNSLLDDIGITDSIKRAQLLFMAEGLPAELCRLSSDDAYFTNRSLIVKDARELIRGNTYQKLLIAHTYKDDRGAVLLLLLDMAKILKKSIIASPQASAINQIDSILSAYQQIETNGNIRLVLARMIL